MNTTTAAERLMTAFKTRRALIGSGLAALGVIVGVGANDVSGRKRAKVRRRRKRRRRNDGTGPGGAGCIVCPRGCQFSSIQAALEGLSGFGGQVSVCAGTYHERITFNGALQQGVTIIGAGDSSTIIDADGDGPAVTVDARTIATLEGLAITGGKAPLGGGIVNRGELTLKDVNVIKNSNGAADGGGGGGIYNASGARLTVMTTEISDNNALDGQGGGILNDGGAVALQANSLVTKNMADEGGGIFNRNGGTVTIDANVTISGNEPDNCVGTTACGA